MTLLLCLVVIALSLVAVAFVAYCIAEVLSSVRVDRTGAIFSTRCATAVSWMAASYPFGSVNLYDTHVYVTGLYVTGWGRYQIEYRYISDIVTGFAAGSLSAPPWWTTMRIAHASPGVPLELYVIMNRRKARIFRQLLTERIAAVRPRPSLSAAHEYKP